MQFRWAITVLAGLAISACGGKSDLVLDGRTTTAASESGLSGARRLTRTEYDNTLKELLAETSSLGFGLLPPDTSNPFDNDYHTQLSSPALIEALEVLAATAAARVVADPAKRDALMPCRPSSPADAACFRSFIAKFGRRALRRPLTADEVAELASLQSFSVESGNFYAGVELVIRFLLQHPEFIYRVEIGTPVSGMDGVYRLNGFEIATRLSYFLWGTNPPDWLLDLAETGRLDSPAGVRAAADRLLQDPRARARVDRFHALWLGYSQLPHAADLTRALQAETNALVNKVVFEDRSDYFDLFRSNQTYLNNRLASHYGLPSSGTSDFQWVSYGSSGRRGLLSHGSFLSNGAKFSDTSPTQRGIFIRTRLLCEDVPPPPPDVNVDEAPTNPTSHCKADRYASHASVGSCAGCHQRLDPIGFGLENYDRAGRYRTHDDDDANCTISGEGRIAELGNFRGPAGLEDLLMQSGQLERCVVTQVYRFATGRMEGSSDSTHIDALTAKFKRGNRGFVQLLLDLVSDETFGFRKED